MATCDTNRYVQLEDDDCSEVRRHCRRSSVVFLAVVCAGLVVFAVTGHGWAHQPWKLAKNIQGGIDLVNIIRTSDVSRAGLRVPGVRPGQHPVPRAPFSRSTGLDFARHTEQSSMFHQPVKQSRTVSQATPDDKEELEPDDIEYRGVDEDGIPNFEDSDRINMQDLERLGIDPWQDATEAGLDEAGIPPFFAIPSVEEAKRRYQAEVDAEVWPSPPSLDWYLDPVLRLQEQRLVTSSGTRVEMWPAASRFYENQTGLTGEKLKPCQPDYGIPKYINTENGGVPTDPGGWCFWSSSSYKPGETMQLLWPTNIHQICVETADYGRGCIDVMDYAGAVLRDPDKAEGFKLVCDASDFYLRRLYAGFVQMGMRMKEKATLSNAAGKKVIELCGP
eukprot:gnl/MRDRNA2_/MRDRNA2_127669_c0_seq1.p1 gnl/MRDRNA2_/MRDRNA2_127669_c0~~gnl/MRDRNA2_/MRDRNA2_127669_c0_seq1.p1  ORF type:complete len:390 (-),score=54.28 gnl/MRDRNA2_/MRDRNA2_127669_c0_seq1:118-1287(-)